MIKLDWEWREFNFVIVVKRYYIAILLIISTLPCMAQVIRGTVVDHDTNQPLVYVNIGVIGTNAGTLSNEKGEFKLTIRTMIDTLKVRFSMIGYEAKVISLNELQDGMVVRLAESTIIINEVLVKSSIPKTSRLGSTTSSKHSVTGWGGFGSGAERAIKIESKKYPIYPTSIGFNLAYNKYDSVLLRLHIRSIKNGLPAEELLNQNVFVKVKTKSGATTVDVSPYNLEMKNDFVISFEWITAWGECKDGYCLLFSLNRIGGTMFAKEASDGKWKEIKRNSPGIFVDFNYE